MPKPQTDEQFAADIVRRLQGRVRRPSARSSAANLAFTVATIVVAQVENEGQRDMLVAKFSAAFRGAVDRYRENAKLGVDGAK
jgi:hypothetical protein